MSWRRDELPTHVRAMANRPRHEALRGHITAILHHGFHAAYEEIAHERYLLDNTGRIDTMWGATVIELKSDLRREQADVEARMPDYLADAARRARSPRPVTGLATDGATFIGYQLEGGTLQELRRYTTDPDRPGELLAWLELLLTEVEADFFDWPLKLPEGAELVRQLAEQTARFRLTDVETDVLKVLYESLVDPDQRHDLGEYYTPDWLAGRVVAAAVDAPLKQRVLDPACGSCTFLFHAARRLIATAQGAGWTDRRIVEACAAQVRGMDVHPVAVTLARVTWLLALGKLLLARPAKLTVPVFLGDAMQWNLRKFVDRADVAIEVPGETRPLRIPLGFAEQQEAFESGLDALNRGGLRMQTRTLMANHA